MKRVLKWNVPVGETALIGTGQIVLVACQYIPEVVQVWTIEYEEASPVKPVAVFGTGHEVPQDWSHIGSTVTYGGQLVWHVFEAPPEEWKKT